ncbi:enhancer of polycomb-like-domain-containing protein [Multifurca ochricompacta]|uniref:Enhancer of polycomb-like protein n=1 Tax=Multifurca ochricompacta TaxID=376703 RepID=A0AAD4M3G1_9AGAM|nr:enhancer of polycomb-like-domain-containing protein [Multifurca ochricompacta]
MPRAHNPGPSTLRNRNRVTNKTRLHIVQGSLDADPLAFDEDEEKARIVSTAGVDAEDANEHHLQAVLSAASQRHSSTRSSRGLGEKTTTKQQDAYIPIPDNAGLVDDYESLYQPDRWRDPVSYVKTSETSEETLQDALAHGFTYFMDERDKEWLDKNNEEARGEGTSAQGAVSASGTTTRTSQRSAKAKGKEPDVSQPIVISEDEFELVMGLFEKVTHEKTEFLHHGLEQGSPFPPFSDYQDTFSNKLTLDMFAAFTVPSWIPQPLQLLRFAKAVYPYWKERRIERGGHRIIPTLNFDESDVKNESYISFRRRDVKAMRKTRASQASSSEKLMRLKQELATAAELVSGVLKREQLKREAAQQAKAVWEKREDLANLKRKFPSLLNAKEDEELFYDKERVVKKAKPTESGRVVGLKLKSRDNNGELVSPAPLHDTVVRPKERAATILAQIDREMARFKERDHHWEDGIENAYQPQPVTQAQRHFKWIPPPETSRPLSPLKATLVDDSPTPEWRAVRIRRGRGGVLRVDRRSSRRSPPCDEVLRYPRRLANITSAESEATEEELAAEREISWRIHDRWLLDADDEPSVGSDGPDEKDRVLVDEFHPKYLLKGMSLYQEDDHQRLTTDPTIYTPSSDGRLLGFLPYRTGIAPAFRRDAIIVGPRPLVPQTPSQAAAMQQHQQQLAQQSALGMPQTTGTPISMQQQMKKLPSALNVPQMRISSNGSLRPPATPVLAAITPSAPQTSPQSSPTLTAANSQTSPTPVPPSLNGSEESSSTPAQQQDCVIPSGDATPTGLSTGSPMPMQPNQGHHAISLPNGYHMQNNYAAAMTNGATTYLHPGTQQNGLSVQQIQLKNVFSNGQQEIPIPVNGSRPASYIGHVSNGTNFNLPVGAVGVNVGMNLSNINLKLPSTRPMQWATTQRSPQAVAIAHSLSPHMHPHSPAPQVSPPRGGQTPTASPSLHQQQVVGGSGATY